MPGPDLITSVQFARLLGLPDTPVVIDVRNDDEYATDPRLVPASIRRDYRTVASWGADFAGHSVIVVCQRGLKLSHGVAGWLRQLGARAETLVGGFEAWR